MKKTAITSFIAILAFVVPTFAEGLPAKADLSASALGTKEPTTETKKIEVKAPLTKKQKTEADLRSTSSKLKLVVERTQKILDLLTKKNKNTDEAQTALDNAITQLEEANDAIDQFAGVVPVEVKDETLTTEEKEKKTKEIIIYKDPLKKAQESLKSAKTSIIESIANLKEILIQKEVSE